MEKVNLKDDRNIRKPRKIMTVKPSKYDGSKSISSNKKYWTNVLNELDTSTKPSTEEFESQNLLKILPSELYIKVCNTLNIPIVTNLSDETPKLTDTKPRRLVKDPLLSFRKSIHVDRVMDSDTDVELSPREEEDDNLNIHQEFLKKPIREQVTWPTRYLKPEREDEKSLVRKADDLTDKIAQKFCNYMKQLGGDQQSRLFTPKAIKELFQIEFDTHVARGLQIVMKEIPCIDEKLAEAMGDPEKSRFKALEREVSNDIHAEHRPDRLKAFGRSLPLHNQWKAPRNDTKELWRSARHVPKDLVTLKTVWEGITNLRSVKEYCRWMIDHPEHRRPPYLRSLGMFDLAVLEARLTFESQHAIISPPTIYSSDSPTHIDYIRKRLSELADSTDN